jgi:hypothetical protein
MSGRVERRLAVLLATHMGRHSRLIEADEKGTIERLAEDTRHAIGTMRIRLPQDQALPYERRLKKR